MRRRSLAAMLAIGGLVLTLLHPAAQPVAQAAGATPTVLVNERYSEWAVGGGFIYWADCHINPDQSISGGLRRAPLGGGVTRTLASTALNGPGCATLYLAADSSGVYYWNGSKLLRRTSAKPDTPITVFAPLPTVQPTTTPSIAAGAVYLATANQRIYRIPQGGGSGQQLIVTAANPTAVLVVGSYVYWLDNGGLHRSDCPSTCGQYQDLDLMAGSGLAYAARPGICSGNVCTAPSDNFYWVSNETPPRIHHVACSGLITSTCNIQPIFYTPSNPPAGFSIGPLASDGTSLFWAEGAPASIIASCDNQQLNRAPLSGGGPTAIGPDSNPITYQVGANGRCAQVAAVSPWVYLDSTGSTAQVARLPADAPPTPADIQINAWEVTQGIQSLNNDVPLIAGKPTFVRLYGSKVSGPRANSSEAVLRGFRNNIELPGSPLTPLNGSRSFSTNGSTFDRSKRDDGWLFQLPESWISAGQLNLQATLDPRNLLGDPNLADNTRSGSFGFNRRAPVCTVFIPVRTNAPAAATNLPNFWEMVARFKTLWPVPDVWTYQQSEDVAAWSWFSFIPYDIPENNDAILTKIFERDLFSDDPDRCDDADARTHYVGMVHPATNSGTNGGYANLTFAYSWVKLPPADDNGQARATNLPTAGSVMAQELSHNYNGFSSRWRHVNCGSPSGVNPAYPYNPCKLDDRAQPDPAAHYGFDPLTLTPVAPDTNADYMSYRIPAWVSDYTWRGMYDEVGPGTQLLGEAAANPPPGLAASTGPLVLISGIVTPTVSLTSQNYTHLFRSLAQQRQPLAAGGQARLNPAITIDASRAGVHQLAKWQRLSNPPAGVPLPNVRVQLLGSNNQVLRDQQANLGANDNSHNGVATSYPLFALLPAPTADVARINVLVDGNVVTSLAPPAGTPTVALNQPAGGSSIDKLLTVSWVASHPNRNAQLYHTIQYSPDLGQHWRVLTADYAGIPGQASQQLTFSNLSGLPGSASNQALVRVITTDGYHSAIATSAPFTLAAQPPQPFILSPANGQRLAAGPALSFSGGASDPREGALAAGALRWQLDGQPVATGQAGTLAGLAPGEHILTLSAQNTAGRRASTSVDVSIAPLIIPSSDDTTPPDGSCDKPRYSAAAQVPLAATAGQVATALLVRTANDLWVCLSGLARGTTTQGSQAGVVIDVNASRDAAPQPTDYGFFVGEDGTPRSQAGSGNGGLNAPGPAGLETASSATSGGWTAELRIPAAVLGGWNHLVGIDLVQQDVATSGDQLSWPARASLTQPSSWGTAVLGIPPQLASLNPASVPVGSARTTLTVNGSGFATGASVLWNGSPRPTTFVSTNQLQATIATADLATATTALIGVSNPGLGGAAANSLPLLVTNPLPIVTNAAVLGRAATCQVQLSGSRWASGVQLLWNGAAYPATQNGASIQASIPCTQLLVARTVQVAAYNPAPGGGVSNVRTLAVSSRQLTYVPSVRR